MEYTDRDVLYTAFPLFHVNAKYTSVVSTLLSGARLILDDRLSASRFWQRMREEHVTSFNYLGTMLTSDRQATTRPRPTVDHEVDRCYGGAADPALWSVYEERFGVRLRGAYGMTGDRVAIQNTRLVRRPGSIGLPAPHFEARVADPEDRECEVGEVGEIQIQPATSRHHAARVLETS